MDDKTPIRKRRIRYRGTHPRQFEEKYKELNPECYPDEAGKILESGRTPAGTHRPICLNEVLEILRPQPGEVGLDATIGYGGHAVELLKRIAPNGRLIGIDVDPLELPRTEARLRAMGFTEEILTVRRMNFAGMPQLTPAERGGFDFALADLGVSSMQLDNPVRGFTFKANGPLDLRFNPQRGEPASTLIESLSENELADLLTTNADEPHATAIATAISSRRHQIRTTTALADVVRHALRALPSAIRDEETKKSLQRTFQAFRIAVNDEFNILDRFLDFLPSCLMPGGRAAIISFHSGEDRRVKKSLQAGHRAGIYESCAAEPIRPSKEELRANPRSSSAKLRWAVKRASISI